MMSGREVSQAGIQVDAQTWQNEHLVYTHGYGAVSALVNQATAEGAPEPDAGRTSRCSSDPGPELSQPRIYFGEGSTGDTPFVVVGTKTPELDYEGSTEPYAYDGTGGIPMGNPLAAGVVRVALPRREPVDLGPDLQHEPHHDLPRHRPARAQARAVPHVRPGSVLRGQRGPAGVDLGRLHHDEPVPVLPVAEPERGDRRPAPAAVGQLHAELGEGGHRCLRRNDDLLREPVRSDHPGVGPRLPRPADADRGCAHRPAGALPLPGEHLPDAGDAVRQLPRHRRRRSSTRSRIVGRCRPTPPWD